MYNKYNRFNKNGCKYNSNRLKRFRGRGKSKRVKDFFFERRVRYIYMRWVQVTPGVTSQESHLFKTIDFF